MVRKNLTLTVNVSKVIFVGLTFSQGQQPKRRFYSRQVPGQTRILFRPLSSSAISTSSQSVRCMGR